MRTLQLSALLAALVVAAACGGTDDATPTTTSATPTSTSADDGGGADDSDDTGNDQDPSTSSTVTADADADADADTDADTDGPDDGDDATAGTVNVRLESIDGFFVEGFEVGLRFETTGGEVLAATLWSDVVDSLGDSSPDAYYTAVHAQQVPAGEVVVLATVNVGIGPPPAVPDLAGPLACELTVDVPAGGEVDVEVAFDDSDCLSEL